MREIEIVRPTCLARDEECRGTCGQPQRYSLHASPVQRTPSLPHSLPKCSTVQSMGTSALNNLNLCTFYSFCFDDGRLYTRFVGY